MRVLVALQLKLSGGVEYWQDTIVKCRRPGKAGGVTEAQYHDEGRSGRSVTGVQGSVTGYGAKV